MVIRLDDDQEEKDLEGYFHMYDNQTSHGFTIDPMKVISGELLNKGVEFIKSLKNSVIELCTVSLINDRMMVFLEKLVEIGGKKIRIRSLDGFDVNLLKNKMFGMF